jgi:hypothetical protein
MESLKETVKQDKKRREQPLSEDEKKSIKESQEKYEEQQKRVLVYNEPIDYYNDIYYKNHFFIYKTYHSYYAFGRKLKKVEIPKEVLPYIRSENQYITDRLDKINDKIIKFMESDKSRIVEV